MLARKSWTEHIECVTCVIIYSDAFITWWEAKKVMILSYAYESYNVIIRARQCLSTPQCTRVWVIIIRPRSRKSRHFVVSHTKRTYWKTNANRKFRFESTRIDVTNFGNFVRRCRMKNKLLGEDDVSSDRIYNVSGARSYAVNQRNFLNYASRFEAPWPENEIR